MMRHESALQHTGNGPCAQSEIKKKTGRLLSGDLFLQDGQHLGKGFEAEERRQHHVDHHTRRHLGHQPQQRTARHRGGHEQHPAVHRRRDRRNGQQRAHETAPAVGGEAPRRREVDDRLADRDRDEAPDHGHDAAGNRQCEDHRHDHLLEHLDAQDDAAVAADLQDVERDHRERVEEPHQADRLEVGHRGHPLLAQQCKEVGRHGREAQHHREHGVGDDHRDLAVALGEFRIVAVDLGESREDDPLHGHDRRRDGRVLEFLRLIEVGQRVGPGIEASDEELREFRVERRDEVRTHETEAVGRHFAQRRTAERRPGAPVADPPQQRGPHADEQHALRDDAPQSGPGERQRHGRKPADGRRREGHLREQGEAELPREERVLHRAEGRHREQQEEDRRHAPEVGLSVELRHPGRHGHEQQVERHGDRKIEDEDRLVVLRARRRLADEHLREAAVDDHQRHDREGREHGHVVVAARAEQAQQHEAHTELEKRRSDLLGEAPGHAARHLLLEFALHAADGYFLPVFLSVVVCRDLGIAAADAAHVGNLDIRGAAVGAEAAAHDRQQVLVVELAVLVDELQRVDQEVVAVAHLLRAQNGHDAVGEGQDALRMEPVADGHHGLAAAERRQVAARAARLRVEHDIFDRQVRRGTHGRAGQLRRDLVVHRDHVHVDHRLEVALVALDLAGDARHGLDRLDGIVAHGRLVAQHHGVDTLVDGAGHVAHLGARRTRRLDHRIEHLRGDDDGALRADALLDDAPLRVGDRLGGELHTQVAARHHDAVGGLDDLVDVVQPLLVLDLRDDLDRAVVGIENLLHGGHVARRTDERVRDEVDVVADGPLDEAAVLLGHRGQFDRDPGHVNALARAHGAADQKFARELLVVLLHDADLELAVGDEHARPDGDVAHDRRHVHVDHLARGLVVPDRAAHRHAVARRKTDAVAVLVGDRRDADLRALRVDHDRNGGIDLVHGLDDAGGTLFGDVRRVDAHDIHAGVEQLGDELLRATEIRHRCDDLGFFHSVHNV